MRFPDTEKKRVISIAFNLFAFFSCVYLLTASDITIYDTVASIARYEVTKSLVERFDLSIPEGLGFKGIDGRDYSWYGLGQSLLAVPFYIVGKIIGTPEGAVSVMNQIMGAAVAVVIFIFVLSLGYSKRVSIFVSVIYGLCTMAWPLAKQPFDHTIETFFILFSVYCMYLYVTQGKISNLIFSSVSLGFAFITRPTSILVIPSLFILMIFFLRQRNGFKAIAILMARDIILFSIAFLPFLSLTLWYNNYRFGSILETGSTLLSKSTGIDLFSGTSFLTGLNGLLISPGKGFFYYSPVAILFFFSIKSFIMRHRFLSLSFILIILSYLLFYSKYLFWHGDWAWGPRYLLMITPFLIIPIAELIESHIWQKKKGVRLVVYLVFTVSLVIQIAAVSVDFNKHLLKLRFEENLVFTIVQSHGIQPTVVPPPKIYFDWKRSPILAQFKYIYEIYNNIKNYRYSEPVEGATVSEKMRAAPFYNIFDFWWLYKYFVDESYIGIYMAVLLMLLAIFIAIRLWKISYRGQRCRNIKKIER